MLQIKYEEPLSIKYLPIVAQKSFLSCKSDRYGWFVSSDFVLPFIIEKKFIFNRIIFTSSIISVENSGDEKKANELNFLKDVIKKTKELGVSFIYQPMTHAVFSHAPVGSIHCKSLSYFIDLENTEEELFQSFHSKHRNVVKNAQKNGVEILSGSEFMDECYNIIKNTMQRQNKPFISYQQVRTYREKLGENVSFYIAKKDGVVQGGGIFIWSKGHSSYYFHGGSSNKPYTGAVNLLQWQAICDMKKNGVRTFDFVGGRLAPLKGSKQEGIQRFKSRFGATAKLGYLWKYPLSPLSYKLFRGIAHLNALRHRRRYLGDIIDEEHRNLIIRKNILMTFDYELFLGSDSGTIEKSLIDPVDKILELFKLHSGKAVFFVDSTFLVRLKSDSEELFNKVKKNIQKIIKLGHNVELHLHPQWIDADWNKLEQKWSFSSMKNYRFHSLTANDQEKIFSESINILQQIISEVDSTYKVSAYRAGGWCSQPFNILGKYLAKYKIDIDFSVVPGMKEQDGIRYFDYSRVVKFKEWWRFSEDNTEEDSEGMRIEVPCSIIKLSLLSFLMNKLKIKKTKRAGNGRGGVASSTKINMFKKLIKRNISLNVDFMHPHYFIKSVESSNKHNLVVVGHPKILSSNGMDCMEYFLKNHRTIGIEELRSEVIDG